MFNKFIFAASAAVLISGSAMAADAIVYNSPAPAAQAVNTFSWEGAYAGVNAGYGFGKMKDDVGGVIKPRGFVGGVQAGYNWQFDQVVAGIEADFQGSTMKQAITFDNDNGEVLGGNSAKIQWFGTVRGRLGANIAERTMLYGTAGLAYGQVKFEEFSRYNTYAVSQTRTGYTVGGGVEYAFTDNMTLKTEYLYTDLGKISLGNSDNSVKAKTNFHTVRIGVNYKF